MRKTKIVVVQAEGRDKGKQFLLTEMPASKGEKWATRALLAIARSGIELPDDVISAGMATLAVIGLKALGGVSFEEAEPLLDEMMACIQMMPDPSIPAIVRHLVEDDIEEVATRAFLRSEVLELHTGFSIAGAISRSTPAPTQSNLSPTSTFPE